MPIKLPSHPKLQGLGDLHRDIQSQLANEECIAIDLSEVATLPIAYVQLILSASKSARVRGRTAKLLNPSFPALFAFESIGIDPNGDHFEIGYA